MVVLAYKYEVGVLNKENFVYTVAEIYNTPSGPQQPARRHGRRLLNLVVQMIHR